MRHARAGGRLGARPRAVYAGWAGGTISARGAGRDGPARIAAIPSATVRGAGRGGNSDGRSAAGSGRPVMIRPRASATTAAGDDGAANGVAARPGVVVACVMGGSVKV